MKKVLVPVLSAFILASPLPSSASDVYMTETFALGTLINSQFKTEDKQSAAACYKIMNDETRRLEYLLSAYDKDSDVSRLNQNAGKWVSVAKDTYEILQQSKEMAKASEGAFDPTVGALVSLWSVDQPSHRVPPEKQIKAALSHVDYEGIELKTEGDRYLAKIRAHQNIALGAIGKGFIADKVLALLNRKGCKDALLSFGGNIIGSGTNAAGVPWLIGLQRPDRDRGAFFAVMPLDNTSVVVSGDYEKFFVKNGVKYTHILDPKTGSPVPATLSSVAIIDKNSARADALCTALFVMGWDKAVKYLQDHPQIKAVIVDEDVRKAAATQSAAPLIKMTDHSIQYAVIPDKGPVIYKAENKK